MARNMSVWRAPAHIILFGACLSLPACASSGNAISEADRMFLGGAASWDANKDDVVTCDEWKSYAGKLMNTADKNKDGSLSTDEFQTLAASDRTFSIATFKYFDVNADGKVARAEFVDRPNPAFALADGNRDCQLSAQELQTARSESAPKPQPKPMIDPRSGY